jgi:hypothetical protein
LGAREEWGYRHSITRPKPLPKRNKHGETICKALSLHAVSIYEEMQNKDPTIKFLAPVDDWRQVYI